VAVSALARLAAELEADGGLLAATLTGTAEGDERLGALAAGPRAAGHEDPGARSTYLLLDAAARILEGSS